MEKMTVTFENEDKTKKGIITVEYYPLEGNIKPNMKFEPEINQSIPLTEQAFYVKMAVSYFRDLTS